VQASHAQHPPHSVRAWLATLGAVHVVLHVPPGVGLTVPAGQSVQLVAPASSSWPAGHCGAVQVVPAGHSAAQAAAAGMWVGAVRWAIIRRCSAPCTLMAESATPLLSPAV
jgi:hypothetical protein